VGEGVGFDEGVHTGYLTEDEGVADEDRVFSR
jgi:hypothetical protein